MKKCPLYLLLLLSFCVLFALRMYEEVPIRVTEAAFDNSEQLIVFSQETDEHFRSTTLPKLQAWAKEAGLQLDLLDVQAGVPADITATPAIVFQSANGRSVYASRYAEFSTIQNFIRSSRIQAQGKADFCQDNTLQLQSDRARLNVPVKLTTLTGAQPANWNASTFDELAIQAFASGMKGYEIQSNACIARTDRIYYADLHPYLSKEGQLYISIELYSMFNCIRAVWSTGDQPLQGEYSAISTLFTRAGQLVSEQIVKQITEATNGDAWSPLPNEVQDISWEQLGYELPMTTAAFFPTPNDLQLATKWQVSSSAFPGVPALFFRFMEPLERYAGEVPEFSGQLLLGEQGELQGGEFTAGLRSLTMGMQELDDKVKRKYLYTKRFPDAAFHFSLPEDSPALLPGQTNRLPVLGTFKLMKQTQQKLVQAEITPRALADGGQELLVHVHFDLNITDDYGIQGPDGPDPANKTVVFDLNFIMQPQ